MEAQLSQIISIVQMLITTGTFIGMIYAFYKFASKPETTQNARITALENWKEQVEMRLQQGSEHFDKIDEGNRVTQNAILAIMDALLNNENNKEELKKQRDELYSYLTNKR